jgi:hypothetical protein
VPVVTTSSVFTVSIWFRWALPGSLVGPLELGHLTAQPLEQLVVGIGTVLGSDARIGIIGERCPLLICSAISIVGYSLSS